jgi:hypothetical protein
MKAHWRRSIYSRRIGYEEVNPAGRDRAACARPGRPANWFRIGFSGLTDARGRAKEKNALARLSWRQSGVYS